MQSSEVFAHLAVDFMKPVVDKVRASVAGQPSDFEVW